MSSLFKEGEKYKFRNDVKTDVIDYLFKENGVIKIKHKNGDIRNSVFTWDQEIKLGILIKINGDPFTDDFVFEEI